MCQCWSGCVYVCWVAQSCPTLCNPMDSSPPGFSVHGDFLGKNTEVGCYDFLQETVPTQRSNPGLQHCRRIRYQLCHQLVNVWRNAITQPHVKLIGKDLDAGKDWRWGEKGMTEDEMVGWHHWLSGHDFEQALGVGDGQGSLACCSPWGHKELDMTERLNWTDVHLGASLVAQTVKNPPALWET